MSPADLRRFDALYEAALSVSRATPSGRMAMALLAERIEPAWLGGRRGATLWRELAAAREAGGQPMGWRAVERTLRDAWGANPADELDHIDRDPVVITPVAQIHRGELEGRPVTIKVLRRDLRAGVRTDLVLLDGLAGPLGAAFPRLDVGALLREIRERVLDELDLEHEADLQRRIFRALRDHPRLLVPAPVTRLAHEDVLVSEQVHGTPLTEVADQRTRDAGAVRLLELVLGGLGAGLGFGDVAPGAVLVLDDGRVALSDLAGAHAVTDPARAALAADAAEALIARDATGLGDALEAMGALEAARGPEALRVTLAVLGPLAEAAPVRLDTDAVVALRARVLEQAGALAELAVVATAPPADLWPLRGAATAFGVIAQAGAAGVWPDAVAGALRDGWAGSTAGRSGDTPP